MQCAIATKRPRREAHGEDKIRGVIQDFMGLIYGNILKVNVKNLRLKMGKEGKKEVEEKVENISPSSMWKKALL